MISLCKRGYFPDPEFTNRIAGGTLEFENKVWFFATLTSCPRLARNNCFVNTTEYINYKNNVSSNASKMDGYHAQSMATYKFKYILF